jgi:outer membrane biogenesis lipoprotein LolB
LPLEASTHWLLGEISGTATDGWRVTILAREGDQPSGLPTALEFARDDILIRLKIDEWTEVK